MTDQGGEDILHVEDPIAVSKARLAEMVVGIVCHGIRLPALAPMMVSLFASVLLAMTITETHERFLPPLLTMLPADLQDESLGWDEVGQRLAVPFLSLWFGMSLGVGFVERITGWRLRRYAPKLWHWLVFFLIFFTGISVVTVVNAVPDAPLGIMIAIVAALNAFCAFMASFSAVALRVVAAAEEGSVEAIRRRYGLVDVSKEEESD